jgi:hypothetical protein
MERQIVIGGTAAKGFHHATTDYMIVIQKSRPLRIAPEK